MMFSYCSFCFYAFVFINWYYFSIKVIDRVLKTVSKIFAAFLLTTMRSEVRIWS